MTTPFYCSFFLGAYNINLQDYHVWLHPCPTWEEVWKVRTKSVGDGHAQDLRLFSSALVLATHNMTVKQWRSPHHRENGNFDENLAETICTNYNIETDWELWNSWRNSLKDVNWSWMVAFQNQEKPNVWLPTYLSSWAWKLDRHTHPSTLNLQWGLKLRKPQTYPRSSLLKQTLTCYIPCVPHSTQMYWSSSDCWESSGACLHMGLSQKIVPKPRIWWCATVFYIEITICIAAALIFKWTPISDCWLSRHIRWNNNSNNNNN